MLRSVREGMELFLQIAHVGSYEIILVVYFYDYDYDYGHLDKL